MLENLIVGNHNHENQEQKYGEGEKKVGANQKQKKLRKKIRRCALFGRSCLASWSAPLPHIQESLGSVLTSFCEN